MTLSRTHSRTTSVLVGVLLCAPAAATQVKLAWVPVSESAGYRVYWRPSTQPYGQGIDVGGLLPDADGIVRCVVGDVATDVPTYFAVTAYDTAGAESAFSNELLLKLPLLCAAAALAGCSAPVVAGGAVLSMRNVAGVNRDRLGWNWRHGAAAGAGDFGDPSRDTNYV